MSLILDALRKADSERARESVPGLHTQPVPPLSLETALPARRTSWPWIALVGVALLVAALAWVLLGRVPPPVPERAAATEPVAMAGPRAATAPNAVAPNAPLQNAAADNPAAEAAKDIAPPAPWPAPERKSALKQPARANEGAEAAKVAAVPAVYAREELPDSIRSALPPLAVSGSIYSGTPANRSLILDGRLYRENDLVATDLTLEEIRQKTAVLRFRGYRFEIRY